ncbi:hypothetical protein LTR66_008510 [Elasticomyces elasticus]|nr:hypothetical protein LTR66_008510 [Elasticomyces elasticus]KAK4985454.1 hypothetical protein LTR50_005939 [Elasticomyces elasticus]
MSHAPTLINLPPPPSDPLTPSDIPGTPNSTTTSMSELSTVAIKDGHRGHLPHHSSHANPFLATPTSTSLDQERADRISRLAGLERVATARHPTPLGNLTPGVTAPPLGGSGVGYFDQQGNPVMRRERSTVGSASATGSVGGRTTWASGSDAGEAEDMDIDASSVGDVSESGTGSLVGFGEGARTPARQSVVGFSSPAPGKSTPTAATAVPGYMQQGTPTGSQSSLNTQSTASASAMEQQQDARMINGMTYDQSVVDTSASNIDRTPESAGMTTARIVRERLEKSDANGDRAMGNPRNDGNGGQVLGRFAFDGQ